jgi:hypothetical protein
MARITPFKYRLKAGSILELLIAMSIIAATIAIFTLLYTNINQSSKTLDEINEQGFSYSKYIYTTFIKDTVCDKWDSEYADFKIEKIDFNGQKGLSIQFISFRDKLLWETERMEIIKDDIFLEWDEDEIE